jgi:hypothetical protein
MYVHQGKSWLGRLAEDFLALNCGVRCGFVHARKWVVASSCTAGCTGCTSDLCSLAPTKRFLRFETQRTLDWFGPPKVHEHPKGRSRE